jgi:polygalacturonase
MKRMTILCAALALSTAMASAQIATTSAPSYANPTRRSTRYVITDFGAVGDGKTLNTKAIQAAIDKCASTRKGGVLVTPRARS